ncbi:MAG: GTPase, partial [Acutalibacteraceae bacterium]|nr:GTPase [Acutalibacteraceae bacterium]
MSKPIVAIVGRPNVGKSTLFNKLIGQRLSIVEDTPGVTRDRIFGECEWKNRRFSLVDTGGIEPESKDVILSQMRAQAQIAIDSADVIIFVTDVRTGMVATDLNIAQMLQRSNVPVIVCVNKCDTLGEPPVDFYEFYNLGLGDPIQVSSVHGHGTGDLLDAVLEHLPEEPEDEEESEIIKVAVIGKPNVGKSSLV